MSAVDDYLETVDPGRRPVLEHVRAVVRELLPDATEGRSYGVPALFHRGKPVIGFVAAKAHFSIYPYSSRVVDAVREQLPGYDLASGTIRFTADRPLTDAVLRDVVRHRVTEIDAKT